MAWARPRMRLSATARVSPSGHAGASAHRPLPAELAQTIACLGFNNVRFAFSVWMTGSTSAVPDQYLAQTPTYTVDAHAGLLRLRDPVREEGDGMPGPIVRRWDGMG